MLFIHRVFALPSVTDVPMVIQPCKLPSDGFKLMTILDFHKLEEIGNGANIGVRGFTM